MTSFTTAVNIGASADFEIEGAKFVGGLQSHKFVGPASVTKNEATHIQFGPSAHYWVDGNIDATSNVNFRLKLTVHGFGNGWFRVLGVDYAGDGTWHDFHV